MIIISGIMSVDPSEHDAAVALIGPLVEETLKEPGNGTYGFWAHPSEPGVFRIHEEWEDEDSLNAHMTAPHFVTFMEGMAGLTVTGTAINRHDVSETTKFM